MPRVFEVGATLLAQRFGAGVLCGLVHVDGDPSALLPVERAVVATAVPARQREFAAGRACARALLVRLGFEPAALLPGPDRAPLWPRGVLGSITHDRRLCAVVVARAQRFVSLGIDVEPAEPLEEELWPELFLPRELERLRSLPRQERGRMARLLFSAKECVYKCIQPMFGARLGFHDVEISPMPQSERFRARLSPALRAALPDLPLHGFHLEHAGSVLSGMVLPRSQASVEGCRDDATALSVGARGDAHKGRQP